MAIIPKQELFHDFTVENASIFGGQHTFETWLDREIVDGQVFQHLDGSYHNAPEELET